MGCNRLCEGCPFDFGAEETELAQNYGCLPTPREILNMRAHHGKTWACHSDPATPCVGAIKWLKSQGLPYRVEDPELLTESSPWHLFAAPSSGEKRSDV